MNRLSQSLHRQLVRDSKRQLADHLPGAKAGVHVTFGFGVPAYTDTRGRITAATILFTHIIIIRIGITGITTSIIVTGIVGSTVS